MERLMDLEEAFNTMSMITERVDVVLDLIHPEEIAEFKSIDDFLERIYVLGGDEFVEFMDSNFEEICLTCPVLKKIMINPTMVACGKTFEQNFIDAWLAKGHRLCPVDKKVLPHIGAIQNTAYKKINDKWRRWTRVVEEIEGFNMDWLVEDIERRMISNVNDKLKDASVGIREKCGLLYPICTTMANVPQFCDRVLLHHEFLLSLFTLIDDQLTEGDERQQVEILIGIILDLLKGSMSANPDALNRRVLVILAEYLVSRSPFSAVVASFLTSICKDELMITRVIDAFEGCKEVFEGIIGSEQTELMGLLKVLMSGETMLEFACSDKAMIGLLYNKLNLTESSLCQDHILSIFLHICRHGSRLADGDVMDVFRAHETAGRVIEGLAGGEGDNSIPSKAIDILMILNPN